MYGRAIEGCVLALWKCAEQSRGLAGCLAVLWAFCGAERILLQPFEHDTDPKLEVQTWSHHAVCFMVDHVKWSGHAFIQISAISLLAACTAAVTSRLPCFALQ